MQDDLNISRAWGEVFEWVRETNRLLASGSLTPAQAAGSLAAWNRINTVLGLQAPRLVTVAAGAGAGDADGVSPELAALLDQRQAARKAKDFKRADVLRDELKSKGWVIEDTPKGARLKRL